MKFAGKCFAELPLDWGSHVTVGLLHSRRMKKKSGGRPAARSSTGAVVLLAGGNPQIAKGYGDEPVMAWLAALSGWKEETARRIDRMIGEEVPGVCRAVKWNSPLYGVESGNWFLSLHVFARSVKITFFRGLQLEPMPPGGTAKSGDSRWIDVGEGAVDEERLRSWIVQAAKLPGLKM